MTNQTLPLAGVRVVDYTHFLAGPYLSRCLSAMGAEVIKVERPKQGDAARTHPYHVGGQSGYYLQQNMGKKGLCVDVKDPRGLALLQKLVERADVFVENYRPGALRKLRLGYDDVAALNPRLVYCSLSAYGHSGPDSDQPGFGLIAEAKSGAMDLVGTPGEAPPLFRVPIADMFAGIHGVAAVCAALFGRQASGRGTHIDLALYDCMLALHEYAVQVYTLSGGKDVPERSGRDLPQSTVYGVFRARDGDIAITAQADDAWRRLATLIGGEALARDARFQTLPGRNAHRDEVIGRVRDWVAAQPSAGACLAALAAAEVPSAKIQRIDEVLADPQIRARGMIFEQEHPVLGRITMPNVPFRFAGLDVMQREPAPLLGQHNRSIASSLGYCAAEIEAMERDGVLYAEAAVSALPDGGR